MTKPIFDYDALMRLQNKDDYNERNGIEVQKLLIIYDGDRSFRVEDLPNYIEDYLVRLSICFDLRNLVSYHTHITLQSKNTDRYYELEFKDLGDALDAFKLSPYYAYEGMSPITSTEILLKVLLNECKEFDLFRPTYVHIFKEKFAGKHVEFSITGAGIDKNKKFKTLKELYDEFAPITDEDKK